MRIADFTNKLNHLYGHFFGASRIQKLEKTRSADSLGSAKTYSVDSFITAKTHLSSNNQSQFSISSHESLTGRVADLSLYQINEEEPAFCDAEGDKENSADKVEVNIEALRTFFAGKKFLIVDDNLVCLMALENLLKKSEIVVQKADGGLKAEGLAKAHKFDVILMDYNMPGMNGDVAIKLIRKIPGYERTPIIANTANEDPLVRKALLNAGANEVMMKPCMEMDLLKRIRELSLQIGK